MPVSTSPAPPALTPAAPRAAAPGRRRKKGSPWLIAGYALGPAVVVGGAGLASGTLPGPLLQVTVLAVLWGLLTLVLLAGRLLRRRPLPRHLARLLGAWTMGALALAGLSAWMEAAQTAGACVLAYGLGLALVCAVVPWQRRARLHHFNLLDGGSADELVGLGGAVWSPLGENELALTHATDAIVADLHAQHPTVVLNALAAQALQGVPILHAATAHELLTERVALRFIAEESIQEFTRPVVYDEIKRVLDLCIVVVSLPFVLPLMALIALVVRLESPGPVVFRQHRVGHLGRPFTMFKFRSMDHRETAEEAHFTAPDDARVTRVGRFIRTFRIDELPQFWNVLRGEMSIIGPRPEQVRFVETFEEVIPLYPYRHTVRPGITGWSQVKLGYAASTREAVEKLEYDLYYVKHLSFSLDLLILFKTARTIVTGYGAR